MAQKTWTPNETQKRFLKILGENPDGMTYREIKAKYGIEFKTGAINPLITKGLVAKADGTRDFVAEIVYNGEVLGTKAFHDTVYVLVK